MVKIVDEGPRRVRCKRCNSLLEYTANDIHTKILPFVCIHQSFIFCPNCQNDVWL